MLSATNVKIEKSGKHTFKIIGQSNSLKNEYGDAESITAIYDRNSGAGFIQPMNSNQDKKEFSFLGKHPEKLLSDETARKIFLRVMSPEQFAEFRKDISVSDKIKEHNVGMQYSAQGMAPHSGGGSISIFCD